jgi:hypothetical protein
MKRHSARRSARTLSPLDVVDSLNLELQRLRTLAQEAASADEEGGEVIRDVGALVAESHAALKRIVDSWYAGFRRPSAFRPPRS